MNYEKIIDLNPDLVILCENDGWEMAEEKLKPFGISVVVCNSYYTNEFERNVKMLGDILGLSENAEKYSTFFLSKVKYINEKLKNVKPKKVYFEYKDKGRTTNPGDYFYEMVKLAHAKNIFDDSKANKINIEDVVVRNPQYILKVSDVGLHSSYIPPSNDEMIDILNEIKNRPGWDSIDAIKNEKILLLSHYAHGGGSKIMGAIYLAKFLYPEELPDLHPEEIFKEWVTKYEGLEYIPGNTYPRFS